MQTVLPAKWSDHAIDTLPGSMLQFGAQGGLAERLKALVLKTSVGKPTVGSNPSPSADFDEITKSKGRPVFALCG